MALKLLIAALGIGLLLQGTTPVYESPPVFYPVIVGVTITAPDGAELDPAEAIALEPGESYMLTAIVQRDLTWGDESKIGPELPEGWELSWGSNFGEFPETPQTGNHANWTAPDEAGEVIFQVRLNAEMHGESVVYNKSFRVMVGEGAGRPDYAPDVAVIMFQDWCDDPCVESWALVPPAVGVDRRLARSLNIWRIHIDPEVDVLEAVREMTWWPCVRTAEPDYTLMLFREGTQSWAPREPGARLD